jgi:hypothetical protein
MSSVTAGRLQAVYRDPLGSVLAVSPAAGDTTITVEDTSDFDEQGGALRVAGQLVEYTSVDADTGVVTLATPLT